jgi:transposase
MNKSKKFSPEVRERAVRLVQEHRGEYPSLWAAIESIAPKIGCMPQTLLDWVKRHEIDSGMREGVTTAEAQCYAPRPSTRAACAAADAASNSSCTELAGAPASVPQVTINASSEAAARRMVESGMRTSLGNGHAHRIHVPRCG